MIALNTEMALLGWSTVLLLAHVIIQGQTATRDRGLGWNAGARDGDARPLGLTAGRSERMLANFQETYPAFVALALGLTVTERSGGIGAAGAWLWFAARLAYMPLYIYGIPLCPQSGVADVDTGFAVDACSIDLSDEPRISLRRQPWCC